MSNDLFFRPLPITFPIDPDPGMTPQDPGPADLGQAVKDVFGAISDATSGGAHTPADIGQVFGDISKMIADEASRGHTGDSKVISGDIDHTVKDFFQAISDAGKGGEHASDGFGKVAGDLGKLLNDLEHDGNKPGNQPVPHHHANGADDPVDQHQGDLHQGGLSHLGDAHGLDTHMHDAHVIHH
jgi:hypothetical protein